MGRTVDGGAAESGGRESCEHFVRTLACLALTMSREAKAGEPTVEGVTLDRLDRL